MEKSTRDRLTGAAIFFAALVVLVPELLSRSGPKPDGGPVDADPAAPPLTTYELSIHPSAAPATGQQELAVPATDSDAIARAVPPPVTEPATIARSAPSQDSPEVAAQPPPAPAAQPPPTPAAQPLRAASPAPSAPQSPPPAATPAAKQAAATESGKYWVQLGAFAAEENARRLSQELRAKGFAIETSKLRSGNRDLQVVRVGPVADRAAALELQRRLAAAGRDGRIVGP